MKDLKNPFAQVCTSLHKLNLRWIMLGLLLMPLTFSPFRQKLYAQVGGTGSGNCSNWRIEVCENYQIPDNGGDSPICSDGCFRVYYNVYLVNVPPNTPGGDDNISFTGMYIEGQLVVTPNDLLTVGTTLSQIDVKASEACSPATPGVNNPSINNSPNLSYDPVTRKFSWEASTNNSSSPTLNWLVSNKLWLFSLAVDVFPNETVNIDATAAVIVLASPPTECSSVQVIVGCTPNQSQSLTSKTIPQPTNQCVFKQSLPQISYGLPVDAPTALYPRRKLVPVFVKNTSPDQSITFGEIDFLSGIEANENMIMPTVLSGLIDASDVRVYPKEIFDPTTPSFRMYAHATGITVLNTIQNATPTAQNTLFTIVLNGPALESDCPELTLSFPPAATLPGTTGGLGRIDGGDFSCCKPDFGGPVTVAWTNPSGGICVEEECPEVKLTISPSTPAVSATDCEPPTKVYFDLFASATTNTGITDVNAVITFKKSGDFTLDNLTSSALCPTATCTFTLVPVTEPDILRLRVRIIQIAANALIVGPNQGGGQPQKIATIVFSTTTGGCIVGAQFADAYIGQVKNSNLFNCLCSWESTILEGDPVDDICTGGLKITTRSAINNKKVSNWEYYLNRFTAGNSSYSSNCYNQFVAGGTYYSSGSSVSVCPCYINNQVQNVVIRKFDNHLDGVSTFDLVLISKHILGIEPLTNGFKILAADANSSRSITTFDIVELRKLILGVYTHLPYARSWVFVDEIHQNAIAATTDPFLNHFTASFPIIMNCPLPRYPSFWGPRTPCEPIAPFQNYIPDVSGGAYYADIEFQNFSVPSTPGTDNIANFVGFKVGDLNLNNQFDADTMNLTQSTTANRTAYPLDAVVDQRQSFDLNQQLIIPIVATGDLSTNGWQLALQYDPEVLEVLDVLWPEQKGDPESSDRGWNIAAPGELRMLWFDVAKPFKASGRPLCYVKIKALKPLRSAQNLLRIAPGTIASEAYSGDRITPLSLNINNSASIFPSPDALFSDDNVISALELNAAPNPFDGYLNIEIGCDKETEGVLVLSDLLGRTLFEQQVIVPAGNSSLRKEGFDQLPQGQYILMLRTAAQVKTLSLIRR